MTDLVLGRKPPPRVRLGFRFAVFGLVVVLVVGLLTTRLFYLQVIQGGYYAGLSQDNRRTLLPLRSARGLIYDRAGRQLAINIPSYVVRLRPADLPFAQREATVARLSALLEIPQSQIVEAIDRYANQSFDLVRLASDVPSDVARIIIEESDSLPGVAGQRRGAARVRVRRTGLARHGLHRRGNGRGAGRVRRRWAT